ncbi:MAG: tRNA (adenosine(37)-N6)-threonylcarbamoyltransferase complex dimerization subunit type 1 TsaB [Myxococcota bacterium]|nr:tRNA (adenosine(37)-N6)-threonylcarbamoyltransferase complex dimerization subunit type 1 TsaB [Myxococcota bacterium]
MSQSSLLLAIECATRTASVAIARGEQILVVRSARSDRHHAESLLAEVDAALREARIGLDAVEAFAVSVGPGAFTSLRIGLATVKGLAFASGRPVVPVSTLAAIAHGAPPGHPRVAALLDARRGEVYAGEFDRTGPLPRARGEEAVETATTLATRLAPGTRLAGEIPPRMLDALQRAGRADLEPFDPPETRPRALAVASLGRVALAAGGAVDAAELVPRYLRRPEAEERRLAAAPSLDTGQKLE